MKPSNHLDGTTRPSMVLIPTEQFVLKDKE
jgi:hypothetical protein